MAGSKRAGRGAKPTRRNDQRHTSGGGRSRIIMGISGSLALLGLAAYLIAAPRPAAEVDRSTRTAGSNAVSSASTPVNIDPSVEPMAGPPPLQATPGSIDFGEVAVEHKQSRVVQLENASSGTLRITRARGNCACTTAELGSMVIEPWSSVPMTIFFDPGSNAATRNTKVSVSVAGFEAPLEVPVSAIILAAPSSGTSNGMPIQTPSEKP